MLTTEAISTDKPLTFEARIERHHPNLPRFVLLNVDPTLLWDVESTFVAEAFFNGHSIGRRSVKPWGDGRWFLDVTQKHCDDFGIDTGALLQVTLKYVADPTPSDLSNAFATNRWLEVHWSSLRPTRRRQLSQWVEEARQPVMRQRRVDEIVAMLHRPPAV
jgi:hypothetical protein